MKALILFYAILTLVLNVNANHTRQILLDKVKQVETMLLDKTKSIETINTKDIKLTNNTNYYCNNPDACFMMIKYDIDTIPLFALILSYYPQYQPLAFVTSFNIGPISNKGYSPINSNNSDKYFIRPSYYNISFSPGLLIASDDSKAQNICQTNLCTLGLRVDDGCIDWSSSNPINITAKYHEYQNYHLNNNIRSSAFMFYPTVNITVKEQDKICVFDIYTCVSEHGKINLCDAFKWKVNYSASIGFGVDIGFNSDIEFNVKDAHNKVKSRNIKSIGNKNSSTNYCTNTARCIISNSYNINGNISVSYTTHTYLPVEQPLAFTTDYKILLNYNTNASVTFSPGLIIFELSITDSKINISNICIDNKCVIGVATLCSSDVKINAIYSTYGYDILIFNPNITVAITERNLYCFVSITTCVVNGNIKNECDDYRWRSDYSELV